MVIRGPVPNLNKLYIYGTVEFEYQADENGDYYDLTLNCNYIIISGGRLIVGWEDKPFMGEANIILRGNWNSEELFVDGGPLLGAKAIGEYHLMLEIVHTHCLELV